VLPRRQGTHTGSLDPLCPVSAFAARLVRRACGYIGTFPGTTGNCRRWKRELPARRAVSRTGSFKGDAGGAEWPNQAGSRAEQCVLICFAQRAGTYWLGLTDMRRGRKGHPRDVGFPRSRRRCALSSRRRLVWAVRAEWRDRFPWRALGCEAAGQAHPLEDAARASPRLLNANPAGGQRADRPR